ncbi:hypothetical protein ONZ45_g6541 [Pleurotus djamor]|nr:hypothetical protein ONZ45_g6541 [Pleurotus djamor]
MHFHVLGIGPVGSLIAFHLRRSLPSNHAITLVYKSYTQSQDALKHGGQIAVESNGLLSSAKGFRRESVEIPRISASTKKPAQAALPEDSDSPSMLETDNTIESLIVTTKAHQTVPAIQQLLPRLASNATIVLLQNGMGVYEKLISDVFRNPAHRPHFLLASNTHGAFLRGGNQVVHAGHGSIEFGIVPDTNGRNYETGFRESNTPHPHDIIQSHEDPAFPQYRSLRNTVAAMLMLKSLNVSWKPMADMQVTMRRKLVVNSVINPLTALMGCRNGDIFTTEASLRIMRRVCQEAHDAYLAQMRAETQEWLDKKAQEGYDSKQLPTGRFPRALSRVALESECRRVADLTKGNISSMLSDVRRGRRTEIEFLNGYLVGLGSTYNVPMPANALLMNLVKMRSAIPIDQIF